MNRCYWCNKFRPWKDLKLEYLFNPGNNPPEEVLVCRKGTGCDA